MESIVLDVFQSSIATHKICAEGFMQRSNSMKYEYIYIYIYVYIVGGRGLCTGDVSVENTRHLLGRNMNKYYNYLSPMVHLLPSLKMQSAPPVLDGIGLYFHFRSLVEMRSKYSTKHNRRSHSQGLLIIRQSLALYPGDNIKGSGSMNLHNKY